MGLQGEKKNPVGRALITSKPVEGKAPASRESKSVKEGEDFRGREVAVSKPKEKKRCREN